jgi:antitoxin HigA-1
MSTLSSITEAPPRASPEAVEMTSTDRKSLPAGPRKAPPSHPGAIIGGILDDIGMSVREAARRMGVTPMAVHNIIKGGTAVSAEMAVRLQAFMGNGPEGAEFWLRLQSDHDLWHARAKLKDAVKKIEPAPREPKGD